MLKKLGLLIIPCMIALCGCARNYVITLHNGTQVTTTSKPRLEGSKYTFKDVRGRAVELPAGRVREIAPASMAQQNAPNFKAPGAK